MRRNPDWESQCPAGRAPPRSTRPQPDQAKRGVIVDDNLDRQLVVNRREELAHQHVEAAVAGQRDHLPPAVERLDAVGLPERRSDGTIVERPDDALRSALPDPVGGPQRIEAGVEHEDRVPVGEIADRAGDGLWMDAIGAAREISLLVELAIPGLAVLREPV